MRRALAEAAWTEIVAVCLVNLLFMYFTDIVIS